MGHRVAPSPLADLVEDVILLLDEDARILEANAVAARALGRSPVGMSLDEAFGDPGAAAVRTAISGHLPEGLEAPLATPSGPVGYLWILSRGPAGSIAMCGREIDRIYGLDLIGRLTQDLQDRQGRLEVVNQINRALARNVDIERIDAIVARQMPELLAFEFLQIAIASSAPELCDCRVLNQLGEQLFSVEGKPWANMASERSMRERRYYIHDGPEEV
ncbi:MAG: hypothetical protein KGR26_07670, partial [Cyanobacteria bacterium REEB65]|nr:hypothetical protein [Cyanobacteria bacterium REEB65]